MKTDTFDKDILATLTDEERAAIEDGEEGEPAVAADDSADDDDTVDDDKAQAPIEGKGADESESEDEPEPAAVADPAPAAEAVAAVAAAPVQEEAPKPAPRATEPPAYVFQLPADHAQRVDAFKAKEAALWERFDGGDMSREELQREMSSLADERQQLSTVQMRAELAADMQRQQIERQRDHAVVSLFERATKPDGGGIDYRADKTKMAQLDTFLKALATDDAHADKSLEWFLDEAHKRVLVLNGVAPQPASKQSAAEAKAQAIAKRKPDTTGLDATLAHVPGGQGVGDVGGEFDDIMALEGEAFEDALAEMAKKNPRRFAAFQGAGRL